MRSVEAMDVSLGFLEACAYACRECLETMQECFIHLYVLTTCRECLETTQEWIFIYIYSRVTTCMLIVKLQLMNQVIQKQKTKVSNLNKIC